MSPVWHEITKGTIVEIDGREFRVVGVDADSITIVPSRRPSKAKVRRFEVNYVLYRERDNKSTCEPMFDVKHYWRIRRARDEVEIGKMQVFLGCDWQVTGIVFDEDTVTGTMVNPNVLKTR
jgi:hypothetical protein